MGSVIFTDLLPTLGMNPGIGCQKRILCRMDTATVQCPGVMEAKS